MRMQILFMFCILSFWGCSKSANIYDLRTLPSHWHNHCCWGGHGQTGELISSELPWSISYDKRWMGSREIIVNPLKDLSHEEKMVDGELVRILLKRKDYLIVSFPHRMQNFFAKVDEDHEVDYVEELLIRYRRDLLAVEYYMGTDCFLPSGNAASPDDDVAYYECLSRAKPDNASFLASLGHAYLSQIRRDLHKDKVGVDFKVVSKVDSVVNVLGYTRVDTVVNHLGHTAFVREGADINLQKIEFITRHINEWGSLGVFESEHGC